VIADMEAGLEHLGRSTSRASDIMLVVAEPYFKSLETAARIRDLALELEIPQVYLVANKIRTEGECHLIAAFAENHRLPVAAWVPYSDQILAAGLLARAPIDHCPDAEPVRVVVALAQRLLAGQPLAEPLRPGLARPH
jgi:CO dehydrogenase maturation factor